MSKLIIQKCKYFDDLTNHTRLDNGPIPIDVLVFSHLNYNHKWLDWSNAYKWFDNNNLDLANPNWDKIETILYGK